MRTFTRQKSARQIGTRRSLRERRAQERLLTVRRRWIAGGLAVLLSGAVVLPAQTALAVDSPPPTGTVSEPEGEVGTTPETGGDPATEPEDPTGPAVEPEAPSTPEAGEAPIAEDVPEAPAELSDPGIAPLAITGPVAHLVVHVGGERDSNNRAVVLPPTDGAVYMAREYKQPTSPSYECALVAGTCTIDVPAGKRWLVWAKIPDTVPPGQNAYPVTSDYYATRTLGFGGMNSVDAKPYQFLTAIAGNGKTLHVSGASFGNVDTNYYDDTRDGQWTADNRFSGKLALSMNNPAPRQVCGQNIALVLDTSGSMSGDRIRNLKAAVKSFAEVLRGTPSTISLYSFSDVPGTRKLDLSMLVADDIAAVGTYANALTAGGATNWDAGLNQVGTGYDSVIVLTDGNPTVDGGGAGAGQYSRFAYVEQAIFSANKIKSTGQRLIGIGIGLQGSDVNLAAVAGPQRNSDYFLGSNENFGDILRNLAEGMCPETITVQKKIADASGTIIENAPEADGWNFTASSTTPETIIGAFPATSSIEGTTGMTSATFEGRAGTTPQVTITEEPGLPGYVLDTTQSECLVRGEPADITWSGTSATFAAIAGASIHCTFVNKAPQLYSVTVVKDWVNSIPGDQAIVSLTGSAGGTSTAPVDGVVVSQSYPAGVPVTVAETLAGNPLKGAYSAALACDNGVVPVNGQFTTIAADVTCTFTNTNATRQVTLTKTWIDGVRGDTAELTINGGTGKTSTVTAGHTNGSWTDAANTVTKANIAVGSAVTVAETLAGAGSYTTTWSCGAAGTETTFVMPNADVHCDVTNAARAQTLTLEKEVDNSAGGVSTADLWTLTAADGATRVINGVGTITTPDVAAISGRVIAGVTYTLSEAGPSGYTAAPAWVCMESGTQTSVAVTGGNKVTTVAGQDVTCRIVNTAIAGDGSISKSVVSNVQNADGTWTITYRVTVVNLSSTSTYTYDLVDEIKFGTGIDVSSATVVSAPGGVTLEPTWSGLPPNTRLASNVELLAATGSHVYEIAVNAAVRMEALEGSHAVCDVGSTDPEAGGFLNTVQLYKAGESEIVGEAHACEPPEFPEVNKRGHVSTQNPDASWNTSYTIEVRNPSSVELQATLSDQFPAVPAGWTLVGGAWNVAAAAGSPLSLNSAYPAGNGVVWEGRIPAGTTYTYTVAGVILPTAGATPLEKCEVTDGGLINRAIVQSGDITRDDTGCSGGETPPVTVDKSDGAVQQLADGTWQIDYNVVVKNTSSTYATVYTLTDLPDLGVGFTPVSHGWFGAAPAANTVIAVSGQHSYVYRVIAAFDTTVADPELTCTPGDGGAFYNVATVTFPGGTDSDDACGEPRGPKITKSAAAPSVGTNGAWNLRYTVRVTNTSGLLLAYTATDAPAELPAGVTLTTPWSVAGPAISPAGGGSATLTPGWDGAGQTEIARGMIPSGATHTYTVTAAVLLSAMVDPEALRCSATAEDGTGIWNRATVTNGVFDDNAEACTEPVTVPVSVEKSDADVTQLDGGAWQLDYTVTVTNAHALPTVYSLTDTPRFAEVYEIQSEGWVDEPNLTDVQIGANGIHQYVYRVIATAETDPVPPSGLVCAGPDTAFFNTATVTYPGGTDSDDGCGTPASPVVDKVALAAVSNALGEWTLSYQVTVTNPAPISLWYSLTDTPDALPAGLSGGAWTVGDPTISAEGSATRNLAWNGGSDTQVATGMLAVGDTHVYTVSRTVSVAPSVDADVLDCATPGGGGVWNSATVTNGVGGNTDEACTDIVRPGVDVDKTVASAEQLVDGTWRIVYDVVVTNQSSALPAVYNLTDELTFGGDIVVTDAAWSGPTSGTFSGPTWRAQLATARTLAPLTGEAGVETYQVTAHATISADGWEGDTLACLGGEGMGASGFLNVARATANGESDSAEACAPPRLPVIEKRGVSAMQDPLDASRWAVSYDVTVTSGGDATFYSVMDQPYFASGITRLSATAQRTDAGAPAPVAVLPVLEGEPFVVDQPLGAADVHVYRVVWVVEITDEFVQETGVCAGEGTGFFNSATLTVGLIDRTDADCLPTEERVYPGVTKTARSVAQDPATGEWSVLYDLVVTLAPKGEANPEGRSAKYDLSDRLAFGEGIIARSASWTGTGTGTFADVNASQSLASGKNIGAGQTHTYTVRVVASVTDEALEDGTTACLPDGDPGGFLNTGLLSSGGRTTPVAACAEPHFPEVEKTLSSVVDHKDGTWTLAYQVDVAYPATTLVPLPSPVAYDLTDVPELPAGVELTGRWAAAAVADTPAPTAAEWDGRGTWAIVSGGELTPADALHSYVVSATVRVTAADPDAIGVCDGAPGIIVWNNATVTSGDYSDTDDACAPVQLPDVGIEKTASGLGADGAVEPGESFDYVLTVTNHGTTAATEVRVTDDDIHDRLQITGLTVGTGVTWGSAPGYTNAPNNVDLTLDSLAVGQSVAITVTVVFVPEPVGVAEVTPGSAPEAPTVVDTFTNIACVAMEADSNPDNNCDEADVPVKDVQAFVYATCVADAPRLGWVVSKSKLLRDTPIDLLWAPNGATTATAPGQVSISQPGGSASWRGDAAWPGTAFSASGVATDYPGWRPLQAADYAPSGGYHLPGTAKIMTQPEQAMFVKNGMIVDPSELDFAWRGASTVTFSVNPTLSFDVAFPELTADCASPRHAEVEIEKTASTNRVEAGEAFTYTLATHNLSTDTAADGVVVTDQVPADLKVTEVSWPGKGDSSVFPNWESCSVEGASKQGYGGMLTCTLFGPLQPADAGLGASAAPTITMHVTVSPESKATKIVNVAVVDYFTFGNPDDAGRDIDDAIVLLGVLALTGAILPWVAGLLALLAIACGAVVFVLGRRRTVEARQPQGV